MDIDRARAVAPLIARLIESEGWEVLRQLAAEREQRDFDRLMKALMRGELPTQDALSWLRGFHAGMDFVLNQPEKLARNYETAISEVGSG